MKYLISNQQNLFQSNLYQKISFEEAKKALEQLKVVEVPKGALYRINEYDGSESVEIFNPDEWLVAE